ncbi:hypothetical protein LCGC14_2684430, partial [marine sediment metagenome]
AGNDGLSEGLGAGLRQHHVNAGISSCSGCHTDADPANYTPVGEDVFPPFYGVVANLTVDDPATDNLDNDGDLLYDAADPDFDNGGGLVVDPGGPYSSQPGVEITFDASGTSNPGGSTLYYFWKFNDLDENGVERKQPSMPSPNPTIKYTYDYAGTYTGILTVTDAIGFFMEPFTVNVGDGSQNLSPTADAGGPYSGVIGTAVHFDASGSSDPDGDTLSYEWDFDDGGSAGPGSSDAATHVYQSGGTYTVTLTVDDNVNDPVTATATVEINSLPDVDAGGPYSGKPGDTIHFDGSDTFDADGDALVYEWDFGDGDTAGPGSNHSPTHVYQNAGTYVAELTVSDNVNDDVTVQVEVAISDDAEPPTPSEGDWIVELLLFETWVTVSFEDFAGILLVWTVYDDGMASIGVGMEIDDLIFWMDVTGALYFGAVDHTAGRMQGTM